jgi:hypothetical protein
LLPQRRGGRNKGLPEHLTILSMKLVHHMGAEGANGTLAIVDQAHSEGIHATKMVSVALAPLQ